MRRARLGQIAPCVGATLRYAYDFGDGWDHLIVVERLLWADPGAQRVRCLAGAAPARPRTAAASAATRTSRRRYGAVRGRSTGNC